MKALVTAVLATATMIFAPTAAADTTIDNYVNSVEGVTLPAVPRDKVDDLFAITLGLTACLDVIQGRSVAQEVDELDDNISTEDAARIVNAAIHNFCPNAVRKMGA